jgi:hypothetical protein
MGLVHISIPLTRSILFEEPTCLLVPYTLDEYNTISMLQCNHHERTKMLRELPNILVYFTCIDHKRSVELAVDTKCRTN